MPNIIAHSHITSEVLTQPPPDVILGSTIKDFAGMYLARTHRLVKVTGVTPELDQGVTIHNRADDAFDQQPEAPQITMPLIEDLQEVGVPYKAARLSSRFAADIFLDRALLDFDLAMSDYQHLHDSVLEGQTVLSTELLPVEFSDYVKSYFISRRARLYRNIANITLMTYERLASRTDHEDFVIPTELVPVVSEVFAEHADRAGELGLRAMAITIAKLRQDRKF